MIQAGKMLLATMCAGSFVGCALLAKPADTTATPTPTGEAPGHSTAARPSLPCKAGVALGKAVVGHMEPYTFQNGLKTEKQSYFKVDGEVSADGCTFKYTKDANSEQCMLVMMDATADVKATNDLHFTCVMESDTSKTTRTPSADYRRIIPVCPTKGANGWCSNNTTDLGAKEAEFFEKMTKENKVAFFGCISGSHSNAETGMVFCSAGTYSDKNQSLFQLEFDHVAAR